MASIATFYANSNLGCFHWLTQNGIIRRATEQKQPAKNQTLRRGLQITKQQRLKPVNFFPHFYTSENLFSIIKFKLIDTQVSKVTLSKIALSKSNEIYTHCKNKTLYGSLQTLCLGSRKTHNTAVGVYIAFWVSCVVFWPPKKIKLKTNKNFIE